MTEDDKTRSIPGRGATPGRAPPGMPPKYDTIAAIATAEGDAGLAVIRISGPDAMALADRFADCRPPAPSRRKTHVAFTGRVRARDGRLIDEALFLPMRAPHSYTGEDVIEIQCHGGRRTPRRILAAVCDAGARVAAPGEFTRRAFLNGRMDLLQAESVLDLVRAQSDRSAQAALEQMEGRLSVRIHGVYDLALSAATAIEASLDFSEDFEYERIETIAAPPILDAVKEIDRLLSSATEGRLLREGARVVIAGRPNAGKSTLFNALLGFDRAIVTRHPGTTRDTIEESMILQGIQVRLTDTAGLRTTECEIESEGVKRSINRIEKSELVVYVIDAQHGVSDDDRNFIQSRGDAGLLVVLNKADLSGAGLSPDVPALPISALTGLGLDRLRESIANKILCGAAWSASDSACVSERHAQGLKEARRQLIFAGELLSTGPEDRLPPVAVHLRAAINALGEITGREYHSELLNVIFNRFCVGK